MSVHCCVCGLSLFSLLSGFWLGGWGDSAGVSGFPVAISPISVLELSSAIGVGSGRGDETTPGWVIKVPPSLFLAILDP